MTSNQKDLSKEEKKQRLPPGQHITKRFPILQSKEVTHIDRNEYKLVIEGEVDNPVILTLEELNKLKDKEIIADIHCVTTWSKFDTKWGGISFRTLFNLVKPKNSAQFVEFYCADNGFTTTVPLERLEKENAILALTYENLPIDDNHGGPVRPIIPNLYFYKSAKWVLRILFLQEDRLGYWERNGYSNKADPWKEQRYREDD
ncbi:MAG: molybdopterin-dependent oxidoreductase [Promethearchaeota archaeon]